MALKTDFPFDTPLNYEFNNDLIKVENGRGTLKDTRPQDATFYNSFNTDKDADWCNGNKIGTLHGGAIVAGGKLDLTGYVSDKYISYSALNNVGNPQTGCIRFKFIPNYSGVPTNYQCLCGTSESYLKNEIFILHTNTAGELQFYIYGEAYNDLILNMKMLFNPIAGVEYEIEFDYNVIIGESRVFIDGVLIKTNYNTGTMGTAPNFYIGKRVGSTYKPNFYINDFLVFLTVQHTVDYTPDWNNIPETKYSKNNPTIKPACCLQVEALNGFTETVVKAGNDNIKYTLLINGIEKYWDSANWISGTGYSIANTAAEIATNCSLIDFGNGMPLKFVAYLHSENGMTIPELDNLQIDYDFFGGQPSDTKKCIVYGFIYGSDSLPIENVVVRAKLKDVADYNNEIQIGQITHSTKTNCVGYWELELTETDSLEDNIKYTFEFLHQFYNLNVDKNVPDVATKNFAELI